MAEWKLLRIGADYEGLAKEYGMDPVTMRIIRNRGIKEQEEIREFLYGDESVFDKTDGFADMYKSIKVLKIIKENNLKIRIIGDYDIDGICATAILQKGLTAYGINCDYTIPNRVEDGYGLSASLIEKARQDGMDAIITCDNGISAHDAVLLAKKYGMMVIVTDHHEIMREQDGEKQILPAADAVINPKREENELLFREYCGAYVAYKLMSELLDFSMQKEVYAELREELLSLAAFATVGDIMPLQKENRTLVKKGLEYLTDSVNPGMRELILANELNRKKLKAHHIGFLLGPCINATGRLDTAERALKLLITDSENEAHEIAIELKRMNEVRKELTIKGTQQANEIIAKQNMADDDVLVIFLPDTHESIAGIIAGRLKERYYKPAIVFTQAKEGIKGSGRSVSEYDMFAELCKFKSLFTKFGGHPMAAGISMPKENLEVLRDGLNDEARKKGGRFQECISIDVDMPFGYVTPDLISQLDCLEPFGNGNPRPLFAQSGLTFFKEKRFGEGGKFATYSVKDAADRVYELKYFGDIMQLHEYVDGKYGQGTAAGLYENKAFKLSVIYQPEINTYRGISSVQFRMLDYK